MQAYFARRARRGAAERKASEREGWGYTVVRGVRSIALVAFLVLYAINPAWLGEFSVPGPDWLRWMGVGLGIASLAVYAWSRSTLGREWSSCLRLREKQHLVTTGPYAWVRHPIYLALMVFLAGLALVTLSWFLIVPVVISIADLVLRIPKEERMMIEAFGDEYRAYMRRTGRLLPSPTPHIFRES